MSESKTHLRFREGAYFSMQTCGDFTGITPGALCQEPFKMAMTAFRVEVNQIWVRSSEMKHQEMSQMSLKKETCPNRKIPLKIPVTSPYLPIGTSFLNYEK